jgi:hypothetical protein
LSERRDRARARQALLAMRRFCKPQTLGSIPGAGSSTWVAKRQRDWLLTSSPQVRVLPHVPRARADWTAAALLRRSMRVRILPGVRARSSSGGAPLSEGGGCEFESRRAHTRPRGLLARLAPSHGAGPGSIPGGVTTSAWSNRQGCWPFTPAVRVQIPMRTPCPRRRNSGLALRTPDQEVRLLSWVQRRRRQRATASHKRGPVGPAPTAGTRASSNGRAAVLQTADGGSIPSARTAALVILW